MIQNIVAKILKVKATTKQHINSILMMEKEKTKKVAIFENFYYLCSMDSERKILYYKDYFPKFFFSLSDGAKKKVAYVPDVLKTQQRPGKNFVKFIRDGVYELRAQHEGNIYRAFFIFDEGNIVMLFNGFQKKSQKTPQKEIEMAIRLKNEYYAEKG